MNTPNYTQNPHQLPTGFVQARGYIRKGDLIYCKKGSTYTVPTNSQLIGQPVTPSVLRPTVKAMGVCYV